MLLRVTRASRQQLFKNVMMKSTIPQLDRQSLTKNVWFQEQISNGNILFVRQALVDMKAQNERPHHIVCNQILHKFSQLSLSDDVVQWFQDFRNAEIQLDSIAYDAVILALTRLNQTDKALGVFNDMKTRDISPSIFTYNCLLSCLGASTRPDRIQKAFAIFQSMTFAGVVEPDAVTFNTLISICARSGKWDLVMNLVEMMDERNISRDVITYTSMIISCEKTKDWRTAVELLSEMNERGITPNEITFAIVIKACIKGYKCDMALKMVDFMLSKKLQPTSSTVENILGSCRQRTDWKSALELIEKLRHSDVTPASSAYTTAIELCQKAKQWDHVHTLTALRDSPPSGNGRVQKPRKNLVGGHGNEGTRRGQMLRSIPEAQAQAEAQPGEARRRGRGGRGGRGGRAHQDAMGTDIETMVMEKGIKMSRSPSKNLVAGASAADMVMDTTPQSPTPSAETDVPAVSFDPPPIAPDCTPSIEILLDHVSREKWEMAQRVMDAMKGANVAFPPDLRVYNTLMAVCNKNGRWRSTLELFEDILKKGIRADLSSLVAALCACEKGKQWRKAMALLGEMESQGIKPNVVVHNIVIECCVQAGQWKEGLKLLRDAQSRGLTIDNILFSTVMSACVRAKQWQKVLDLWEEMKMERVQADEEICALVMTAMGNTGRWREALDLLGGTEVLHINQDSAIFNAAMLACERAKRLDEALNLLKDMRSKGIKPDVATYNSAMLVSNKVGRWAKALELFEEMISLNISPDTTSYNSAISAHQKQNNWLAVLDLLQAMETSGLTPNIISFSAVLAVLRDSGRWREALEVLERMRRNGIEVDALVFHDVMAACAMAEQWEAMFTMMEEMKNSETPLDPMTVTLLKKACAETGRWRELTEALYAMGLTGRSHCDEEILRCHSDGQWREAVNALHRGQSLFADQDSDRLARSIVISVCAAAEVDAHNNGDQAKEAPWSHAMGLLDSLSSQGRPLDLLDCNMVLKACSVWGRWQDAMSLVHTMPSRGAEPNTDSYYFAVAACERDSQWMEAMALMGEWTATGAEPTHQMLEKVLSTCCSANRIDEALEVVDDMKSKGFALNVANFNGLMRLHLEEGDTAEVLRLFSEMEKCDLIPNENSLNLAFSACLAAKRLTTRMKQTQQAASECSSVSEEQVLFPVHGVPAQKSDEEVNDLSAMRLLLQRLEDGHMRLEVSLKEEFVAMLVEVGDWQAAERLQKELLAIGRVPQSAAIGPIAAACIRSGRLGDALDLLKHADMHAVPLQASTLDEAIVACCQEGRPQEAGLLIERMKRSALTPNWSSYWALISDHCARGEWQGAVARLVAADDDHCDIPADCFNAILALCAAEGRWVEALDVGYRMQLQGKDPDEATYNSLISSCASGRNWEMAIDLYFEMKDRGLISSWNHGDVLAACEAAGRGQQALEVLDHIRMNSKKVTKKKTMAAVNACIAEGMIEDALKLLRVESERVRSGAEDENVGVYHSMLHISIKRKRWEDVIQIFEEMKGQNLNLSAQYYRSVITARCEMGQPLKAAEVALALRKEGGSGISHRICEEIVSSCKGGIEVLECAASLIGGAEGKDKSLGLTIVDLGAGVCARNADWRSARTLLDLANLHQLQPDVGTYNSVLRAYASARRWVQAMKLTGHMQRAGVAPTVETFNIVLSSFDDGDDKKRMRLVAAMVQSGLTPNDETLDILLLHKPDGERAATRQIIENIINGNNA